MGPSKFSSTSTVDIQRHNEMSRCTVYPYLFFCSMFVLAGSQTCYFPNGNAAPDTPCNTTAPFSACCYPTDFCLSNQLCLSSSKLLLFRGSCTDPDWAASECPGYCRHSRASSKSVKIPQKLDDNRCVCLL